MPTHEETPDFLAEYLRLPPEDRQAFRAAVQDFLGELKKGTHPSEFPKRFGIRLFRSRSKELWEFRWGADRRALFKYGASPHVGDVHVIWVSICSHAIYTR